MAVRLSFGFRGGLPIFFFFFAIKHKILYVIGKVKL